MPSEEKRSRREREREREYNRGYANDASISLFLSEHIFTEQII